MAVATLAVAVPLVAGCGLAAIRPVCPRRLADVVSIAVCAAVVVLCAIVLHRSSGQTLVYWLGGWEPQGGVALGISLAIDPIGAGTALFAALLSLAAVVFSTPYLEAPDDLFHVLMLVFLAAIVGFAFSGDLFTSFVFFELMTISAFVLAGYQIDQRAPLEGSLNFAITNVVGSFFLLLGIGLTYGRTGALNMAQAGQALAHGQPDALVAVAFALVAAGFLVKAAVVPFHFWLADAYAVARTPVCIMFAGVMSELGLFGVARVWWAVYSGALGPGAEELRAILISVGIVTALLGAVMALVQTHLKRLLAFVTIAYMGLFLIGVGALNAEGLAGAALFVAGDGFLKAALFVCVGILQHRRAHVDERQLFGRGRDMRFTGAVFALGALAVTSLPPFGSFAGKSLVEHGVDAAGYGWVVPVFVLVSLLSGAALMITVVRVFFGLGTPGGEIAGGGIELSHEEPEPSAADPERTPATMMLTAVVLLGASLAVGVIPGLADHVLAAAARFADRGAYAQAVLFGAATSGPTTLAAHVPEWQDFLFGALSVIGAVAFAPFAVRSHRRPRRPAPLAALAASAVRVLSGLRAIHSGHPGDYVAFVVVGAGVIAGLFALTLV